MKTKHLFFLSVAVFSAFYSCKKQDAAVDNNGNSNNGGNNTIVYNVNKQTMLNLVNQARQSGCTCGTTVMPSVGTVSWNDQLAKAAYDHSADMKTNNYFSHTSLDGTTPGTRITTAGYAWSTYGENIAMGYPDEQAVVNAWLNSEGHCKNIMNKNFKEMGVGKEGTYWTQVFGAK
ncbi:MAG: CAP domain-containing protein [Chitinophagaceae bacterium]|nr:CAP domain-containing protein [Chitinophagaceae bacterium]